MMSVDSGFASESNVILTSCDASRSHWQLSFYLLCLVFTQWAKVFLIITSLRFPCPIRAICLSIFLASSTLRSWGMGTTGPLGLEQHLLSQLARGVRNCVAPKMSMQQWSPNSKSCKRKSRKLVLREEERLALEARASKKRKPLMDR